MPQRGLGANFTAVKSKFSPLPSLSEKRRNKALREEASEKVSFTKRGCPGSRELIALSGRIEKGSCSEGN